MNFIMENVQKHRDIEPATTNRRRNYLLTIEMKKNTDTYELTCLFRTFNTRIK